MEDSKQGKLARGKIINDVATVKGSGSFENELVFSAFLRQHTPRISTKIAFFLNSIKVLQVS